MSAALSIRRASRWPLAATGTAILLICSFAPPASAAQSQVGLGTATPYAVLAGATVTNTGPSVISGNVGVSPGTAVTGFPPGQVNNGTIHAADAPALQAKSDLVTAYNDAAGRGPVVDQTDKDLGGQLLMPGVYSASGAMALTGTVTLDAGGDPDAVFVFQAGSTLITASSSSVALVGGAQACNVFWQVGSSATIGTATDFVGSVLALTSISLQTGAVVQGRVLARNGQVSLDTNTITTPTCASGPTTTPTPTDSPTATATPTDSPTSTSTATPSGGGTPTGGTTSGTGTPGNPGGPDSPGGPGGPDGPGGPGTDTPIPTGHPETGRLLDASAATGWLGLAGLLFVGATVAAVRSTRRSP